MALVPRAQVRVRWIPCSTCTTVTHSTTVVLRLDRLVAYGPQVRMGIFTGVTGYWYQRYKKVSTFQLQMMRTFEQATYKYGRYPLGVH